MKDIDGLIKEVSEIPRQLKSGAMDLERAELLITAKSTILESYELGSVTQSDNLLSKKQIKKAWQVIAKTEKEIEKLKKSHDKRG